MRETDQKALTLARGFFAFFDDGIRRDRPVDLSNRLLATAFRVRIQSPLLAPTDSPRSSHLMDTPTPQEVTQLLLAWRQGDEAALAQLVPRVHEELKRLAKRYLRGERPGHLLQTTALVNEAYLRLVDAQRVPWQNRAHFFAVSARLIRQVLVDAARERGAQKRGGGIAPVSLDEAAPVDEDRGIDLMALDEALRALSEVDPRKGRVVELR